MLKNYSLLDSWNSLQWWYFPVLSKNADNICELKPNEIWCELWIAIKRPLKGYNEPSQNVHML